MYILLIEVNSDSGARIREFLESRGHRVEQACDGERALCLASDENCDAVILDLDLPELRGLRVCRKLRESSRGNVPILMLAARDTEADLLRGFEAGADDYMVPPFSLPELMARLKALARRASGARGVLRVADLTFDLQTLIIRRGERTITLTPVGMRILEVLMRGSPAVVTREQVEKSVWGDDRPESDAVLRGHIRVVRNAVENGGQNKLLLTVRAVGYRLAENCS